mmetsp:Transcript_2288/g.2644  ORF Transcript_2288/g.2644 Transcript_2288/m.2644 type:complete len:161 (-) Transcript_2288:235-717(-)
MSLVQCMITRRRSINRHVNVVSSTMISPSIIRPLPLHMNMNMDQSQNVLCSSPSANHTVDTTNTQVHQGQVQVQGQHQTPDNNNNKIGSCKECLFTGVGVCTGLSIYFMKLASEVHIPTNNNKDTAKIHTTIKEAMRQKRFLIGCSAVSAVTGAYRLYLG